MISKKKALMQSIIEIACNNEISQQANEKAIANLIENHIEEPLLDAASAWVCESFLEKDDDYFDRGKYLKGSFEDVSEAVEDLRNEMRKAMEE
jgi:hypothetical protein